GTPTHSCITPVSHVDGKKVTTIEGIAKGKLTALQQAWIDEQVPQCGWCQSGQIMMAEALLREHPKPTAEDMELAMIQVLCLVGAYQGRQTGWVGGGDNREEGGRGRGGARQHDPARY